MEIVIVAAIVLVVVVFIVNSPKKVAEVPSRVPSKIPSQVPSQLQKKENPKVETPFVLTEEFSEILDLLKNTNDSIFITGKAGTGKSSLLKHFIKETNKKHVVLAPTGIAALNVGGQTIHSFFRFQPNFITSKSIKPDYVRAELFKSLQMVIIDEVSMVRSDLMNGIDLALRKNRNRLDEPFGGVQMVFIGDMFQLPPVVSDSDQNLIRALFGGQYFFDATVFKSFKYHFKELSTIFRQTNEQASFKSLLNNIRNNEVSFDDMVLLNSRHKENAGEQDNSIFLTSRRNIARSINTENLEKLLGNKFTFTGSLTGKYLSMKEEGDEKLEDKLPAPLNLELKKDAQIMMLKNDLARRWVNGSIGKVEKLESDRITVSIEGKSYNVERETWSEVEYVLNQETDAIEEKVVAGFSQFPIQLAYAMTIHKSQGKTFDKITVDIGAGAFAHGQVYVALSRCKTIEGIVLNNAIKNSDIIVDPRVIEFYKTKAVPKSKEIQQIEQKDSTVTITTKLVKAIAGKKSVKIQYQNVDGDVSERQLSDIKLTEEFNDYGYSLQHIKAYCHLRKEERSFKISRIKSIDILD